MEIVQTNFGEMDGDNHVRPTALVRCSRGGKTRALKEIARPFKERSPHCASYM